MLNKFSWDDCDVGITRDGNNRITEIKPVDYWWNASAPESMPIYRIGGKLFCAYGWDGEEYSESFEVLDKFTDVDGSSCSLCPVYRCEAESRDPDENDDDFEIVGFRRVIYR